MSSLNERHKRKLMVHGCVFSEKMGVRIFSFFTFPEFDDLLDSMPQHLTKLDLYNLAAPVQLSAAATGAYWPFTSRDTKGYCEAV